MTPEERLAAIREKLKTIVETDGIDAGVIYLSWDSPTTYDPELKCQVYDHDYFSELGDALIALWVLAGGDGEREPAAT